MAGVNKGQMKHCDLELGSENFSYRGLASKYCRP